MARVGVEAGGLAGRGLVACGAWRLVGLAVESTVAVDVELESGSVSHVEVVVQLNRPSGRTGRWSRRSGPRSVEAGGLAYGGLVGAN